MGRLAKYAIAIITAIVTIVTFVGYLTSKSLNTWTKTHSVVIFYGVIFFFMVTGVSLNYLFKERRKYRRLEKKTARVKSSEHDKKLFQGFITILPPAGPVMKWLRESVRPNAFLIKDYKALEDVLGDMGLRPLGFDNPEVEASYGQLHEAVQEFKNVTLECMPKDPNSRPWLRIPPEWDDERIGRATDEIDEIRLELIGKYENFLDLAHKSRADE